MELVKDASWATKARYLRGVVIDEVVNGYVAPEGNVTFHHDALQSVTGLSTHTGDLLDVRRYLPFGMPFLDDRTPPEPQLQYTGRELDAATGLYYYRARYYDPTLGRFLQEGPLGFGAGANFYAYVGNNPLRFNDPSGLLVPPPVAIGGLVGLGFSASVLVQGGTIGDAGMAFAAGAAIGATLGYGAVFFAGSAAAGGQPMAAFGVALAGGSLTGATTNALTQMGQIGLTGTRDSFSFGEMGRTGAVSALTAMPAAAVAAGAGRAIALNASQSMNLGQNLIAGAHGVGGPLQVGSAEIAVAATSFAVGAATSPFATGVQVQTDSAVPATPRYPSTPAPPLFTSPYWK